MPGVPVLPITFVGKPIFYVLKTIAMVPYFGWTLIGFFLSWIKLKSCLLKISFWTGGFRSAHHAQTCSVMLNHWPAPGLNCIYSKSVSLKKMFIINYFTRFENQCGQTVVYYLTPSKKAIREGKYTQ